MSDEVEPGLCEFCRELKPVANTDSLGREYCEECSKTMQQPPMLQWFLDATIPFKVGDRVRCYIGGQLYSGVGTITEVSTDIENYGTPVYPSFYVDLEEKAFPEVPDDLWWTETCLKLVDA